MQQIVRLICDKFFYIFVFQTCELTELLNRNKLVILFVQCKHYSFDQITTIPLTTSCNSLNIFRVNTKSLHSLFHTLSILLVGSYYTDSAVTIQM